MIEPLRANNLRILPPRAVMADAPATDSVVRHAIRSDSTTLSTRARELSLAHEAARQAPDVRPERVAALRRRIEEGTYYVPDALLAEAIMDFRV
jgi:flagellar biosynthesis anti-sigma factor FlgM